LLGEGLVFVVVESSFAFFGNDDFVGFAIIGISFNGNLVKYIKGAM
jgi:hypothetical protein